LSLASLYGPSCSAALALANPTALVASLLVSLQPLWLQLLGSLGFSQPHRRHGLAACQPSASMAPSVRQPRLWPTPPTSWHRCLLAFSLSASSCSAP